MAGCRVVIVGLLLLLGADLLPGGCWPAAEAQPARIVGYYTSWSIYARDYHVADIPAEQVDLINYAFANIAGGQIALGDPYADTEKWYPGDSWDPDSLRGCFHQLQILKRAHPHLRTLISVGGWTWSTHFSDVALTPESRSRFAASCVDFVEAYGFDGVDIDWEYPVCCGDPGNQYRPEDRENFTLLLAELRRQLDEAGEFLLTIAAGASPLVLENYELEAIHPLCDWINVMTYDFHGPWGGAADQVTNLHAPLYAASDDPNDEPYRSQYNLDAAIQAYLDGGVPRTKLDVGLPFYGRGYGNVADIQQGLFAPYSGAAPVGTWEPGTFDFWDLAAHYIDQNGYVAFRHPEAAVPWLFNPTAAIMISYDDPASIAAKAEYVLQEGLGGAMCWEFSADRGGLLLESLAMTLAGPCGGFSETISGSAATTLRMLPAVPNPFHPATCIRFALSDAACVTVRIFAADGTLVRELFDHCVSAGSHALRWDGGDAHGLALPSGVYYCVARSGRDAVSWPLVHVQ